MEKIPFDPYDFFGYLASGLLVVLGMEFAIGFPHVVGQELKPFDIIALVFGMYIAGQIIATPAKAILEDGVVDKLLGRPTENLFRSKRPWLRRILFPGFYKPLPKTIQHRIVTRVRAENGSTSGEGLFLHVHYHPEIRSDEKIVAKLQAFLNKYGFSRNLAFASLLAGGATLIRSAVWNDPRIAPYGWTAVIVGVLLFYRYLKFLRQYSYELFNTYSGLK